MKTVAIFVFLFAATVAMKLEEYPPGLPEPGMQILAGLERRPSEKSTGRCVEYGIDYFGYDIDRIYNINHWSDCGQKCHDHRSCSYWTWIPTENKCCLKSSNSGWRIEVGHMSGSYDCLSEC